MEKQKNKGRRNFLLVLGALGLGGVTTWIMRRSIVKRLFFTGDFDPELLTSSLTTEENICLMTSQQVEGPFYFPSPERRELTDDRIGQKLQLRLQVTRYPECKPIENARVDIWHCDGDGVYSGYPKEIARDVWETMVFGLKNGTFKNDQLHVDPVNDTRFLRGMQRTDPTGWVTFDTIIPGWYEGRVPHIHALVVINKQEQFTTQFYFSQELLDSIYTTVAPYKTHGKCPLRFENDIVLSQGKNAQGLLLEIKPQPLIDGQYLAMGRMGINSKA
ncbi:hypothetical protein [Algoriphagus sp.]|uniref:dioxygenase family protein n=1 Tax=Algoriphagus sp. TaxID=1872435 RepID=UPI002604E274|nr:hypothetical protein [Algoriphagus sp.]